MFATVQIAGWELAIVQIADSNFLREAIFVFLSGHSVVSGENFRGENFPLFLFDVSYF